jgi:hypothetical protein
MATTATTTANAPVAEREMLDEAQRFAALLRHVDGATRVPGMRWTAGEIAAHVVQTAVNTRDTLLGKPSAYDGVGFSAEVDQRLVDALPERDTQRLADMVDAEYTALAAAMRERPDDELIGVVDRLTTASSRAIFALDFLLHGTQIARAAGLPAHPVDATTVRTCVAAVLPALVDDRAAAGLTATYALTFRGARPLLYGWESGRLWVEDGRQRRVDCRISADSVAFLLQGIGLMPMWKLALTAKMVATGPKPWLALRIPKLVPAVPHGGVAA